MSTISQDFQEPQEPQPTELGPRVEHSLDREVLALGSASRTISGRTAYVVMAAVIGLALFASGTPSPLYGLYRELWGFSPLALTLVYATYAIGVLTALILAGPVSDQVGRRPVLLSALGGVMAASLIFIAAQSLAWLFVARALQGLATGLALGAASAALLDLHPRRDPHAVGLHNGVASTGGLGLGVLVSALIVELLPAPRVFPYVAALILFAAVFLGVLRMPEPVRNPTRLRIAPQRPEVPAEVRPQFLLAALGVLSSWSIAGIFLSLGPQLSASLFHSTDHLVDGTSVYALALPAAVTQMVFRQVRPWIGAALGSLALAAGMLTIVAATATSSAALYLVGSIIGGGGFGVAFLGALRVLAGAIPAAHRAAVMSAFYIVAYLSLSIPAVLAGVIDAPLGLQTTFEIFGSASAVLAFGVAIQAWRTRPRPRPVSKAALDRDERSRVHKRQVELAEPSVLK